MKKKSSFLWLYLLGLLLAGQVLYICFYVGRWKSVAMSANVLMNTLEHWVLFFAIMIIAAFIKGREKAGMQSFLQLLCALLVEILVLIIAVFLPVVLVNQFYAEYLFICMGRIVYYFGIPQIIAIILGLTFAKITRNRAGYVLALGVSMISCEFLKGYEIYNINYYNPCPVEGFFTLKEYQAYSMSEMLKGLVGKECTYEGMKNMEPFEVSKYNLELWINQEDLFHGMAEITVEEAEKYSFRLSSVMDVEKVMNENGEELSWNHVDNVLTINKKEGISTGKLIIYFECQDETVLGICDEYVSLPDYVMYYPQPVSKETMYYVTIHSAGRVYCNLAGDSLENFSGMASSISILGGSLVGEMYYKDCRILYPMLGFSREDVMERYEYNLAAMPEQFMDKQIWFIDSFASLTYERYYDVTEMQDYDYVFCY